MREITDCATYHSMKFRNLPPQPCPATSSPYSLGEWSGFLVDQWYANGFLILAVLELMSLLGLQTLPDWQGTVPRGSS